MSTAITREDVTAAPLIWMYLITFNSFCALALIIVICPPMFEEPEWYYNDEPISALWLGTIMGLYPLGQFFGSPIIGKLADSYGRHKILILSMVAATVAWGLTCLSLAIYSVWLFMFSLVLGGICESNTTLAHLIISERLSVTARPKALSFMLMCMALGFVIGSGMVMFAETNYTIPFALMQAELVLSFLAVFTFFPNPPIGTHELTERAALTSLNSSAPSLPESQTSRHHWRVYVFTFLVCSCGFGYYRYIPVFLVRYWGMDVYQESIHICMANLCFGFPTYTWLNPWLSRHLGPLQILYIFLPFTFVLQMYLACVPPYPENEWALIPTAWLNYCPVAVVMSAVTSSASVAFETSNIKGHLHGRNQALFYLSAAMVGPVGGSLADLDDTYGLIGFGGMALLALFWGLWCLPEALREKLQHPPVRRGEFVLDDHADGPVRLYQSFDAEENLP